MVATERVGREIEVESSGGRSTVGARGCPRAAAAADGTAAIASDGGVVVVRQPGGRFGPPLRLDFTPADVAVAPGGWVVVAGMPAANYDLAATVIAPDGSVRSHVLARGTRSRPQVMPQVGIDAQGMATVAWVQWNNTETRSDCVILTARATAGVWEQPRVAGRTSVADPGDFPLVGVAVAPSGRRLIAWADDAGVSAALDDGPAERISGEPLAENVTTAVADDGAALVAFTGTAARVLVADRPAAGPWRTTRLAGAARPRAERGDTAQLDVVAQLTPDDRAGVAWWTWRRFRKRLPAASRAAGTWSAAAAVSLPTRDGFTPSFALGPGARLRLLWLEGLPAPRFPRLRGAVLAPAPAMPDTMAPVLHARLPARTPRTRTGRFVLRVPVRCSEACDVRVELDDAHGFPDAATARELTPNRRTTIRLAVRDLQPPRRRDRLVVLASDRAGNLTRVSHAIAVRLVSR